MPLQARLGDIRQKHFAHNNTNCNTASAQQTALHMLAKEIIEEERKLLLPGLSVDRRDTSVGTRVYDSFSTIPQELVYKRPKVVSCTSVYLEKRISDIKPDIVFQTGSKQCLIEIAVTHFVDADKLEKAKSIGLPMAEIDLSSIYGVDFDREIVRNAVLYQPDNRRWVFNPLSKEAKEWAEQEFNKLISQAEAARLQELQKLQQKAENQQQKRKHAEQLLKQLFHPTAYKERLLSLRDDNVLSTIQTCSFYQEGMDLPFFMDIPITGEMVFPCDRRMWQSAVFDIFIFNRNAGDGIDATVHVNKVTSWITKRQRRIPIDWEIAHKAYVNYKPGCAKYFRLVYDVINRYINYLSYLGIIADLFDGEASVEASHTLTPPNVKHAQMLQSALYSTNQYDPNVNDNIDMILHPTKRVHSLYHNTESAFDVDKNDEERITRRHEQQETIRKIGYSQISALDFDRDILIHDNYGYRWLKCTQCGRILREDDMSSYGGINRQNKGICRDCGSTNG